jgi:Mrp family chromosome partitioning ATPase
MVTSANANEGKSTLALSLARTYALSGRNTLLIDCDLRKPSVHKQVGLAPSSRLLEYLADPRGEIDLDYIMVSDPKSTAKLAIGSRRADMAGGQIITGEFFGRLLAEARERFEIVVLDTPPVGAVVDGLYLAQFADSVVLVTRYGTTSQQDARAANAALSDAKRDNVELLSVLNAQEQSRRTARRKYAEYYVN